MRTRERHTVSNHPLGTLAWQFWTGSTFHNAGNYGPAGPFPLQQSDEVISDQEISHPIDYHRVNTVTHVKEEFTRTWNPSATEFVDPATGNRWPVTGKFPEWFYGYLVDAQSRLGPGITNLKANQISLSFPKTTQQLLNNCLEQFYSDGSQANWFESIAEAHDVWPSIKRLSQTFYHMEGIFPGSLKRRVRRLGRFASGSFLFYSFFVSPLIRDMEATRKTMENFQRQLANFLRTKNRPIRYTSTCVCTPTYARGAAFVPDTSYNNRACCWEAKYAYHQRPTKRVVLVGQTDIDYKISVFNNMEFLVNRLGASGPASLLWDLVPFSFVADWFVDVSAWLGHLDNLLTGGRKKILSVSESTTYEISDFVQWDKGQIGLESALDTSVFSQSRVKYYHREAIPASHRPAWSGQFGKKQVALSAALLFGLSESLANWLKRR